MIWWGWLIAGLVLFILEAMSAGGFYLVFFGVGAVIVGLLSLFGIQLGLTLEALVFLGTSLIALALFRKPLLAHFQKGIPTHKVDSLVGQTAEALEDIPVDGIGKAELRGTAWNAHNIGSLPIARASRCKVEKVDGLTLHLRGQ
jgi:membrane protein implicated in regulation of membrane protease activity